MFEACTGKMEVKVHIHPLSISSLKLLQVVERNELGSPTSRESVPTAKVIDGKRTASSSYIFY